MSRPTIEDTLVSHAEYQQLVGRAVREIRVYRFGPARFITLPTRWGVIRVLDLGLVSFGRMPIPQWGASTRGGMLTLFAGRSQITFGRGKE